jgi:hypothetical protein
MRSSFSKCSPVASKNIGVSPMQTNAFFVSMFESVMVNRSDCIDGPGNCVFFIFSAQLWPAQLFNIYPGRFTHVVLKNALLGTHCPHSITSLICNSQFFTWLLYSQRHHFSLRSQLAPLTSLLSQKVSPAALARRMQPHIRILKCNSNLEIESDCSSWLGQPFC